MIAGELNQIQCYGEKGEPAKIKACAKILEGAGIEGDRHCFGEKEPISITRKEVYDWMERQKVKGLCFRRYGSNLVVSGLQEEDLIPGNILRIGSAKIVIEKKFKKCFLQECMRGQENLPCELHSGIVYGRGIQSGTIHNGDKVILVEEEREAE